MAAETAGEPPALHISGFLYARDFHQLMRERLTGDPVRSYQLCVGGQWRDGRAGSAEAVSPASGEVFASVAVADRADVDDAVAAAAWAWPAWAALSAFERAAACERVAAAIRDRAGDLAHVLALDQGKPLEAEARDEVSELAGYFAMAASDVVRLAGWAQPSVSACSRSHCRPT